MNLTYTPSFGRRSPGQPAQLETPARPARPGPPPPAEAAPPSSGLPAEAIAELRAVCLARLEPTAVANMAPERLASDVERLISEIATERRIQLSKKAVDPPGQDPAYHGGRDGRGVTQIESTRRLRRRSSSRRSGRQRG